MKNILWKLEIQTVNWNIAKTKTNMASCNQYKNGLQMIHRKAKDKFSENGFLGNHTVLIFIILQIVVFL